VLEAEFARDAWPGPSPRLQALADRCGTTPRRVRVWFYNRRVRRGLTAAGASARKGAEAARNVCEARKVDAPPPPGCMMPDLDVAVVARTLADDYEATPEHLEAARWLLELAGAARAVIVWEGLEHLATVRARQLVGDALLSPAFVAAARELVVRETYEAVVAAARPTA
jgi:hypothetical protein